MALPVAPYTYQQAAPDPANILAGMTAANGGTIITIPAGRIWSGMVTLSAAAAVAIGGTAINANARVSTVGAGVVPAAGDYVRLDIAAPASAVGAVGTVGQGNLSAPMVVAAPASNSVSLVLNTSNTTVQSASATGVLL